MQPSDTIKSDMIEAIKKDDIDRRLYSLISMLSFDPELDTAFSELRDAVINWVVSSIDIEAVKKNLNKGFTFEDNVNIAKRAYGKMMILILSASLEEW